MKLFKSGEYIEQANPTPGSPYRPEILTAADGARDLGGMFGLLPPGRSAVKFLITFINIVNRSSLSSAEKPQE